MKILVCDDKNQQFELSEIGAGTDPDLSWHIGSDLTDALKEFFSGIAPLLEGKPAPDLSNCAEAFNGFDLAIIDNNLAELELAGARLTAETIIGYLRAFTDISYFVSLNKNPHVDFDLRFLYGDYRSIADLALNTRHLSSNRLWRLESNLEFAPWYWPRLASAAERREKQVSFLENNLETPVWEALGIPEKADQYLSLRAKSALSTDAVTDATFKVFVESSGCLPPQEIKSLIGMADKGHDPAQQAVIRLAAYEADRWVRRDLLGPQDVLIDIPHLLAQMPFLAGENASEVKDWNEIVIAEQPPFGFDTSLFDQHVQPTLLAQSCWTPTPCFWWPSFKSDETLTERFFDCNGDWPDAVFCEDVSRFVSVSGEGDLGAPEEFEAEIAGTWTRRFIANRPNVQYSPRNRIVGSL